MSFLKKKPLFLLLLVLFFCLHGAVENYGFVELKEVAVIGTAILLAVGLLFAVLYFLTRNLVLASLVSFFIGLWYLFFGAIHDWIKGVSFLSFMSSYSVLLPLLLLLTMLFFIILKRKQALAARLVLYLNVLLLIYCTVDLVLIVKESFSKERRSTVAIAIDTSKVTTKPNVYFLLFDEYAGYESLKDSFGFANDSFYHSLEKKKFSMLPVYANYDFTLFSMSAILNMQYVDSNYNAKQVSQRDLQVRTNEIRNGQVFGLFEQMGYGIRNYSIFDIGESHGIDDENALLPVHSLLLTDKILHNRVIRTSGWLFQTGRLALPSWKKNYLYRHDKNNLHAQEMIIRTAKEKKSNPVFTYAHFMMPHWPFYRDSTGKYNSDSILAQSNLLDNKALYLSYLKYTNSVINSMADTIIGHDPKAIVVIMSDHGFRSYKNIKVPEPLDYDNICALRIPGHTAVLNEKRSAVNFFRYVLNTAYGQQFPYLPDRSILLSY